MKISGFTFARNADKLGFPLKASVRSLLPLVDEFVIALDEGDADDRTREELDSLGSEKVRILPSEWETGQFPRNTVYARETDKARLACTGDWLFYLQLDEVLPEWYTQAIRDKCAKILHTSKVEGFLFRYRHFWGDYHHVHYAHNWYPREVRIIRNDPLIASWRDARSFRKYQKAPETAADYQSRTGNRPLRVASWEDVFIHHYGWVRPPELMQHKRRTADRTYQGEKAGPEQAEPFDYGPLGLLERYEGDHPEVMQEYIEQMDWQDRLYEHDTGRKRKKHKHEHGKYRWLGYLEHRWWNHHQLFGARNYRVVHQLRAQ